MHLVEASPYDKIWGVGISEKDFFAGKKLLGKNQLGQVLEHVRSSKNVIPIFEEDFKYWDNLVKKHAETCIRIQDDILNSCQEKKATQQKQPKINSLKDFPCL
jgi:hypothetical protein